MQVFINKNPYSLEIFNRNNLLISADLKDRAYIKDHRGDLFHFLERSSNDIYYGFGEKSGPLNKANLRLRMLSKDSIGYDAKITDPLYKHIPFYIKLNKETAVASGYFYNNTYESIFDMGHEISGYWGNYTYYSTKGGDIDLFFIYGPTIKKIIERYTDLTGKSMMPPLYALGYLGSSMFYPELSENCDKEILDFISTDEPDGISRTFIPAPDDCQLRSESA